MSEGLTIEDYPLSEKRPELIAGQRGRKLSDITLDALVGGEVQMEDLRITRQALRFQAEIARAAGRRTLAENFERGAELVAVPEDVIMRVYELLRPGRATEMTVLIEAAALLRRDYGAAKLADFIEEAAEVYERRGLFTYRF
ncbi:MAG: diol dehydratase small subunit [Aestuariivirgaceae bacterium]